MGKDNKSTLGKIMEWAIVIFSCIGVVTLGAGILYGLLCIFPTSIVSGTVTNIWLPMNSSVNSTIHLSGYLSDYSMVNPLNITNLHLNAKCTLTVVDKLFDPNIGKVIGGYCST
jgi:hypothetical protein